MIIDKYKAFFISIPRTGGHTVTNCFGKLHELRKIKHNRHIIPAQYKRLFPDVWDEYFKFTFVRNPWDRLLSAFLIMVLKKKIMDLSDPEIIQDTKRKFTLFIKRYLVEIAKTKTHFIPQVRWLDEIDFIGRFENLINGLNYVFKKIGKEEVLLELPRSSITTHKHYSIYYTPETKEIVSSLYKEDIKYLNYSFDKEKA